MNRILKLLAILLFVAALTVGELPVWTEALHRKAPEEVHHTYGEAQPELAAEGEMGSGWNGVYAAPWGIEYIILLLAACWALVLQVLRARKG